MKKPVAGRDRHVNGWKASKVPSMREALRAPSMSMFPSSISLLSTTPPVEDQGQVGDCTANACCEAVQALELREISTMESFTYYSRLYLYYWTRISEGTAPDQDVGSSIYDAITVLTNRGVCRESLWDYRDADVRYMLTPPDECDEDAARHRVLFAYDLPNLDTVKACLAQGWHVPFGFRVPANMMTRQCAETGLVHFPAANEAFEGGHAVLAAGYDDAKKIGDDVGALLVQNSWGENFGIGGRFWLPYRFFLEGLAGEACTVRRAAV